MMPMHALRLRRAAVVTDPLFSSVELLVHGGGVNGSTTFTDVSSKAHALTANGNVQHTSSTAIGGENALLFDGTGDYISTPTAAGFDIGSTDVCIEAYLILDAVGRLQTILCNKPAALSSGYKLAVTAANTIQFALLRTGGTALLVDGVTALSTGVLYHIAATRNAAGSTGKVYLNGVQDGNGVQTNPMTLSNASMLIGRDATSTARDLQGKLNWLRLTIGAERYTGNFTAPTMPFPLF